jgi:hypothetical protein
MVGAINPNISTSVVVQRQMALNAAYQLSPGEPFPAEGSPTAEPSPTNNPEPAPETTHSHPGSTSTAPPVYTSPPPHPHSTSLKPGVIAGIVIAGIAVLVLAGALFFFIGRAKTLSAEADRKASTIRHLGQPPSPSAGMLYTGMSPDSGAPLQQAYFPQKPAELDRDGTVNEVASPWHSPRSVTGPTSPDSVARATSQRSDGGALGMAEGGQGAKQWEAPVPLGPYGQQVYEK